MRIGEALVNGGLITSEELKVALDAQKKIHDRLGDIIVRNGLVTAEQMSPFLAQYFDIPFVKLSNIYKEIKPELIDSRNKNALCPQRISKADFCKKGRPHQ